MADLAVQTISVSGGNPTMVAAAAGGDVFSNDGKTFFRVKNGGASSITVTVVAKSPCSHGVKHDSVVSVAAGAEANIGFLDPTRFNDPQTGKVSVTYSAVTTVTVAPVSVASK
ncbi:hypothetical protein P9578_28350 [Brevibacillus choshinensis]|uniref:hypothetical protein n=1 Tax=Brevibacillus choshinensis TaxID=54911 RepID=UPI002E1B8345|nr:hypothetical protein [Brevibacillus choshinensis]